MTNHNLISSFELELILNPILGYKPCILGLFDYYKDNSVVVEKMIPQWESMSDIDIFKKTNINKYTFTDIIIINDQVMIKNKAFYIKKKDLNYFIVNYLSDFGECFFNGDVFFIPIGIGKVICFNHEGYELSYNLPVELTNDGFNKYYDLIINQEQRKIPGI